MAISLQAREEKDFFFFVFRYSSEPQREREDNPEFHGLWSQLP